MDNQKHKHKEFDVDEIIFKLLQAKNYKPNQEVDLSEAEIRWLILKAKAIFMDQPVFIELDSPINVCGDTHGQFYDLLRLFNYGGEPPKGNYLFLGDYVDRGKNAIETISLLFAYKIKYSENFFMLRGNHESENINKNNPKAIFPKENNNSNKKNSHDESENKLSSELDELIIDNQKTLIFKEKQDTTNNYGKMLDNIINKLYPIIETRKNKFDDKETPQELNPAVSKKNQLTPEEIKFLCTKSLEIFMEEPVLLEVSAPVNICGDTHGQFNDLLRLFEFGGRPPTTNYLFLGDYVDRGKNSIETMGLLLAYKIKYPKNIFLLRGNHESEIINHVYGFFDECKRRYNIKIYKLFSDCFNWLPISAIVDDKILCMHGGLSPDLTSLDKIRKIVRPTEVPDKGLLCDLLWSDPDRNVQGWGGNERGVSVTFNEKTVEDIVEKLDIDLVCRAHQVVENGYEFFADKKLVTVFSAPNYCNQFDNHGAMMLVDENLMCGFKILMARKKNINSMMYKNLIRNLTPPPKNRNIRDDEEDDKNSIDNKILNENTNNNK